MEFLEEIFKPIFDELWDKFLNSPENLSAFLTKVPDSFKKYPHGIARSSLDPIEVNEKKKRFSFWLIHKFIWLRSTKFDGEIGLKIHQNCISSISNILTVAESIDPELFRLIIEHFLILLQSEYPF